MNSSLIFRVIFFFFSVLLISCTPVKNNDRVMIFSSIVKAIGSGSTDKNKPNIKNDFASIAKHNFYICRLLSSDGEKDCALQREENEAVMQEVTTDNSRLSNFFSNDQNLTNYYPSMLEENAVLFLRVKEKNCNSHPLYNYNNAYKSRNFNNRDSCFEYIKKFNEKELILAKEKILVVEKKEEAERLEQLEQEESELKQEQILLAELDSMIIGIVGYKLGDKSNIDIFKCNPLFLKEVMGSEAAQGISLISSVTTNENKQYFYRSDVALPVQPSTCIVPLKKESKLFTHAAIEKDIKSNKISSIFAFKYYSKARGDALLGRINQCKSDLSKIDSTLKEKYGDDRVKLDPSGLITLVEGKTKNIIIGCRAEIFKPTWLKTGDVKLVTIYTDVQLKVNTLRNLLDKLKETNKIRNEF